MNGGREDGPTSGMDSRTSLLLGMVPLSVVVGGVGLFFFGGFDVDVAREYGISGI